MFALEIRSLTPDDLSAVVDIHVQAFPTSAMTRLGQEAVHRYYHWLLTGPHYAHITGAFSDGKLLGFCFGGHYSGALTGFLQRNQRYLSGEIARRPWLILTNKLIRSRVVIALNILYRRKPTPVAPTPSPASLTRPFGILSIAVSPTAQGMGVGQALMRAAESEAHARRIGEMVLTVEPHNAQAIHFYERSGWVKVPPDATWKGQMSKRLNL